MSLVPARAIKLDWWRIERLEFHFYTCTGTFVDSQAGMGIAQNHIHRGPRRLAVWLLVVACIGCESTVHHPSRSSPVAMGALPSSDQKMLAYKLGAGDYLGKSVFEWFAGPDRNRPR